MSSAEATERPGPFARPGSGSGLPVAWLLAAAAMLAMGKLERLALSYATRDIVLKDTYYIVARHHYSLRIAAVFLVFAAVYYAFPRLTGYAISGVLGWMHFVLAVSGTSLAFGTVLALQLTTAPERFTDLAGTFATASRFSAIGGYLTTAGLAVFVIALVEALWRKRPRITS